MGFKSAARPEISNLLFKLANTQRSNLNHVYFWEDRIFPISLPRWLAFQESFSPPLYFAPKFNGFSSLTRLCSIRGGPLLSPIHTGCLLALQGSFCSFAPFQHSLPFSFLAVFWKQCGFLSVKLELHHSEYFPELLGRINKVTDVKAPFVNIYMLCRYWFTWS